MNNFITKKRAAAFLAALIASFGLSNSANAQFTLSYEDTISGHTVGEAFTGQFRINLQNFDMGSLYPSLGAPGSAIGFGANGTGPQTVAGGQTTLNTAQVSGATGAINEDTWGIARIISITDLTGSVVWSPSVKQAELTVFFYGENDFYVRQLDNGFQEIDGTGLHVNLYYQAFSDPAFTQYNPTPGSSARGGATSYATVTDGINILQTVSTGGFIHNAGELGGLATEFASIFNQNSGGTGQTYLSVIGGTEAARFNTDLFSSPFVAGVTADMFAQFTTVVNDPAIGDWLVRSNDPVTGLFATPVPEPSTYGLMGAAALLGLVALRRRRIATAKSA